ncbi:MAG: hypothetical protein KF690_07545 [Bacteroidetes bacterium]|nr:hypothetical protein [Bacteroidota bacterium]
MKQLLPMLRRPWVLPVVVLLGLLKLGADFSMDRQRGYENVVFVWDQEGYYKYLQGAFIWGRLDSMDVRFPQNYPVHPVSGRMVNKYTCGVAMLQLPFFGLAHLTAGTAERETQGYGNHYAIWIKYAALCYGIMGLALVWLMLYRQFGVRNPAAALTVVGLALGTNLNWYATGEPAMSHVYSFALFALWLYLTPAVLTRGQWGRWLGYGLILGLITLVRPVNGLIILYPLGWWLAHRNPQLPGVRPGYWLAAVSGMALMWLPQLCYWHYVTGNWLYDSYGAEGFTHWLHPHLSNVLFSHLNGWLSYSPLMLLSLAGIVCLLVRRHWAGGIVVLVFLLLWYLCASWWMWWFGGSLGYRPFIEFYPLLAIPLGILVHTLLQPGGRWAFRIPAAAVYLVGIVIALGLLVRYNGEWSEGNWTQEAWWHLIRRTLTFS